MVAAMFEASGRPELAAEIRAAKVVEVAVKADD